MFKILILIVFLAFTILLIKELYFYPNLNKYTSVIDKNFNYDEYSDPKTFTTDVKNEIDKGVKFPLENPEYVIVKSDKFWKPSRRLSNKKMKELLLILNDSTNYDWGELGTPYFDKYLIFYNSKDECIGLTEVSYDGQTYSHPSLIRMKWGLNNKINEIMEIIEE